jgi:hypothetical protein
MRVWRRVRETVVDFANYISEPNSKTGESKFRDVETVHFNEFIFSLLFAVTDMVSYSCLGVRSSWLLFSVISMATCKYSRSNLKHAVLSLFHDIVHAHLKDIAITVGPVGRWDDVYHLIDIPYICFRMPNFGWACAKYSLGYLVTMCIVLVTNDTTVIWTLYVFGIMVTFRSLQLESGTKFDRKCCLFVLLHVVISYHCSFSPFLSQFTTTGVPMSYAESLCCSILGDNEEDKSNVNTQAATLEVVDDAAVVTKPQAKSE